MDGTVFDSFSETKEGSTRGTGRVSRSQETKSTLSQLLLDAAHTLQGTDYRHTEMLVFNSTY